MRLSQNFWQTYKEVPSDAEIASHQLLMRAGFINKTGSGLYSYLPMATKVIRKIENIVREELSKTGAQELIMNFVTPAELWKDSGRWDTMGLEMLRVVDRKKNDFCLSPTNEEAITDIFRKTITSYKQLPVNLYQISTKFRDEIRPRFGLVRGKEFTMKDAYTFHLNKECMDKMYDKYFKAYSNIIERIGLEFISVEADGGAIASGDAKTHEFQVIADSGEDVVVEAKEIGYAANIETSVTTRATVGFTESTELRDIETTNLQTCEDVAKLLGIPLHQTLKTLVFTATYGNKNVNYMVMILGDDEINEIKLQNFLKCDELTIAKEEVLKSLEVPKGYMSALNLNGKVSVLFDKSIDLEKGYVVGANKENFHTKGFTPSREIEKFKVADLRMTKEGDFAPDGKTPVVFRKGIEVGHIFQLGDKYTKSMKATVLDQNGKKQTPFMGCYGIGITRMMAAAIEQHHDENGMIWPKSIAPFDAYLAVIGKSEETKKLASSLYDQLLEAGVDVLFDDRGMGPGPMFKDADLIGLPVRILLGERDFNKTGELEIKTRKDGEVTKVTADKLVETIKAILG